MISTPNFEGKEKYECIALIFKEHKDKSFSVAMLADVLETTNVVSIQLILDQMILEGKLEEGPVMIRDEEVHVYASKENKAYIADGS